MTGYLTQMVALKKFMISEDKFSDPKNQAVILGHLQKFSELAKQGSHDAVLSKDNFRFSQEVFREHVVDAERVFRLGSKSYARWRLNSTITVCMSCHSQLPTQNQVFAEFVDAKMFASEFDQAEFLFATRGFDRAMVIYDKILNGYPENKASLDDLEGALQRELAYYSRVKRDPGLGILKLAVHQKNKKLPAALVKLVGTWIDQLKTWEKEGDLAVSKANDKEILDAVKKRLGANKGFQIVDRNHPELINFMRASGLLYEYLYTHPNSKALPELLYWLAVSERSMSQSFFYSLASLYLRECIVKFPADPIANQCFQSFEEETLLGYTGSAGTSLPADVKADLDWMRKHIESKGKIDIQNK